MNRGESSRERRKEETSLPVEWLYEMSLSGSGSVVPWELRAPSQNWEQLPVSWIPGGYLWIWAKPQQSPADLLIRIPDELAHLLPSQMTMRHVLGLTGLLPQLVQFWVVQGMTIALQGGEHPFLDHPLPTPVPWIDSTITIRTLLSAPVPATASTPGSFTRQANEQLSAAPMTPGAQASLSAIESDWNSILLMETQLAQMRKQLNTIQGRLQSLNRDFSPDERNAADSNDVKAWQEARRFLRDASAHVSRYIREFDVGSTSSAGQRDRFEQIYKSYVQPKKAFEGIVLVQQEFEAYRKQVQSLLNKMQTALSNAGSNGEQKAQQVLSRVAAKMRRSR